MSYGRILAPFKLDETHQSWIEDSEKGFSIENQCILSNECLLNGSSGGPVLLDGFQTNSTIDRNGNQWIFVEYSAIHFGGEYVCIKEEILFSADFINHFQCAIQINSEKFVQFIAFRFHVVNVYQLIQSDVSGIQI